MCTGLPERSLWTPDSLPFCAEQSPIPNPCPLIYDFPDMNLVRKGRGSPAPWSSTPHLPLSLKYTPDDGCNFGCDFWILRDLASQHHDLIPLNPFILCNPYHKVCYIGIIFQSLKKQVLEVKSRLSYVPHSLVYLQDLGLTYSRKFSWSRSD